MLGHYFKDGLLHFGEVCCGLLSLHPLVMVLHDMLPDCRAFVAASEPQPMAHHL